MHHLRQQKPKPNGHPHYALADFVAPRDSGIADWIGGFAVTTGLGVEEKAREFEARHDDYNSIMVKALADRLAEALAEATHERVRREFWGYAPDERHTNDELIRENYRGIRPAPGYRRVPTHGEGALWRLLDPERNAGIVLTESMRCIRRRGERLGLLTPGFELLRRRAIDATSRGYARRKRMSSRMTSAGSRR